MASSINWDTRRITVPQADLTFVSGVTYNFDIDAFRLGLKDLEDDEIGMTFPRTHTHNTEVTLSGVTYSRTVEIINGYTVEFEDTGAAYTVNCIGANHNIGDVFIPGTSEVSLVINNSAGLAYVKELLEIHRILGLDAANPLSVGSSSRSAGTISQTISGTDPVTVTRT